MCTLSLFHMYSTVCVFIFDLQERALVLAHTRYSRTYPRFGHHYFISRDNDMNYNVNLHNFANCDYNGLWVIRCVKVTDVIEMKCSKSKPTSWNGAFPFQIIHENNQNDTRPIFNNAKEKHQSHTVNEFLVMNRQFMRKKEICGFPNSESKWVNFERCENTFCTFSTLFFSFSPSIDHRRTNCTF